MILMRMREHDAGEIFALLHQVADVRQNKIDTRQMLFSCKRHAQVDRKPGSPPLVPDAVDRQVHADLAHPAEGNKDELLLGAGHDQGPSNPKTSPAVIVVTAPSCSSSSRPSSSRP